MSDANKQAASPQGGSAVTGPDSSTPTGQPEQNQEQGGATQDFNYEAGYKELEAKLGGMGQELGEYRSFFQNISPLLEKLDQSPELVQAIIDGKIDKELAVAVSEGRINLDDAEAVSQANEDVKKEVGEKAYEAMSPDKIEQLVEEKARALRAEFEDKADMRAFEEKTQKFIADTEDFVEFADEIDKWLDSHDVTDIEVAYWAVKGQMSEKEARKAAEAAEAEGNQDAAANAGGGGVRATAEGSSTAAIDDLVGGPANPLF
jgi:hypothetical protein